MGLAKAIWLLEEAKTLDDLNEVKKRIDEALEIIRERHTGKRFISVEAVKDIPYGTVMRVAEAIGKGKKLPQRTAIISILLVKNGGVLTAEQLGNTLNIYPAMVRDIVKRAPHVFVFDRDADTVRIRPEVAEKVKEIMGE